MARRKKVNKRTIRSKFSKGMQAVKSAFSTALKKVGTGTRKKTRGRRRRRRHS